MTHRSLMHLALLVALLVPSGTPSPAAAAPISARAAQPMAAPPFVPPGSAAFALTFMPNQGQLDPAIAFQAQALGGGLDFTASGVTWTLPPATPPETPRTRMLRRAMRPPLL